MLVNGAPLANEDALTERGRGLAAAGDPEACAPVIQAGRRPFPTDVSFIFSTSSKGAGICRVAFGGPFRSVTKKP